MKTLSDMTENDLERIIQRVVRPIFQETQSMRSDITAIKSILGSHDMQLKAVNTQLKGLKTAMRSQVGETKQLGVLLEDLEYRFAAAHE